MASKKTNKWKVDLKNKNTMLTVGIIIFLVVVCLFVFLTFGQAFGVIGISIVFPFLYGWIEKLPKKKKKSSTKSSSKSTKKVKGTGKKRGRKKKKTFWVKLFNGFILFALFVMIAVIIAGAVFMYDIIKSAPDFDPELLYSTEASEIYDSENNLIAELGMEKRQNIEYVDLPQVLVDAIIATEDSRFFQHNGFDLPRFAKASFGQLTGNSSAGGASTLTMQISKNTFTSTDKSIKRKFTDIYMAIFEIERNHTKEEIIEFYVNSPYLGSGSYGVEQASETFFGKSVTDINLAEAALVAGLFQSPGAYDPYLHPEAAEDRRQTVLYLMKRHGYINEEEYEIAKTITTEDLLVGKGEDEIKYQGYIDTVVEEAIVKTGYNPYDVPMIINTNLVSAKQDHVDALLDGELYEFRNDVVQVGIAVTEINTGKVVAIGAGRNREGQRSFNYATMISRQPGSVAKPLFDYGPAIEYNNWSTYHPLLDDAYSYSNGTSISNSDNSYLGLITARTALARSRNIPALKTFQQTDNASIISFVQSLGISPEITIYGGIHEAHAIGGFNGVSPIEIAGAFGAFGNGGYYIEPYTINKIEFKDADSTEGKVVYNPQKERVMKESTAFLITDMLQTAVQSGTASGARVSGIPTAGKTGTTNLDTETKKKWGLPSNAKLDLWLVGYSPDYAISLWYGYDEITKEYYHQTAGWGERNTMFGILAKDIFKGNNASFPGKPSNVKRITVEKETVPAMLPSAHTPADMKVSEYFIEGTEPTATSPRYQTLNDVITLDATFNSPNNKVTITWDYNIPVYLTDSYLEEYFRSIYDDHWVRYLESRRYWDGLRFGNTVFKVYKKDSNGDFNLVGTTGDESFTDTITSTDDITYKVKVSYSNFPGNTSVGADVTLLLGDASIITMEISGDETIELEVGDTFEDEDPPVLVYDNLIDVTSSATVQTLITRESDGNHVASVTTGSADTFEIEYSVSYGGEAETFTRTVIVSEPVIE